MPANSTIMVVDDEPDLVEITKKFLESHGYNVHAFAGPDLALKHFKQCTECQLVVSDIKMPGMSGFELARRLKELRPEIKIILSSSFVIHKEEFRKVMPSLDVDEFVSKPFTKAELIEAIKNVTN